MYLLHMRLDALITRYKSSMEDRLDSMRQKHGQVFHHVNPAISDSFPVTQALDAIDTVAMAIVLLLLFIVVVVVVIVDAFVAVNDDDDGLFVIVAAGLFVFLLLVVFFFFFFCMTEVVCSKRKKLFSNRGELCTMEDPKRFFSSINKYGNFSWEDFHRWGSNSYETSFSSKKKKL